MDNLKVLQCHMCDNYNAAHFIHLQRGYICQHCNAYHYYSTQDEELRCQIGYSYIRNYEFSEAETEFRAIIKQYPDSVAARWGFLLAHFGIVEIKGFYEKKMHEDGTSELAVKPIYCFQHYEKWKHKTFRTEPEYERLKELLANEPEALSVCEQKAAEIDTALAEFKKSKNSSERDIFICVKISNATENNPEALGRTEDFEEAKRLYKELSDRGANVFFSFVTLKGDKIKADYQIWTNLLKSQKMLLIASKNEYLESAWVKSEWKRWRYLNREEQLYIYILDDKNPFEILPNELLELEKQIYHPEIRAKLIEDILSKEEDDVLLVPNNEQELIDKIISQMQEKSKETAKKQKKKKDEKPPKKPKKEKISKEKPQKKNNAIFALVLVIILSLSVLFLSIGALSFLNDEYSPEQTTPEQTTTEQTSTSETTTEQPSTSETMTDQKEISAVERKDGKITYIDGTEKILEYGITKIDNEYKNSITIVSINLPNSVTSIGDGAFYGCSALQTITIPNSVTSIGKYAFYNCSNLRNITIPHSVISIGNFAFNLCTSLQTITIPNSVTSVGISAFSGCTSLQTITIPNSVTSIGDSSFYRCSALQTITIPNSVTSIGKYAFYNCSNLQTITIPNSVTNLGVCAFNGCKELADENGMVIVKNVLYDYFGTAKTIVIPHGVTHISDNVFAGFSDIENITMPKSVVNIGTTVFLRCSNLSRIVFLGTCAEWNAITKGSLGRDLTIICTDGTVYYKNPS